MLSVPMTVTWLPEASTGAVTASPLWLPETVPSSPVVVAPAVSEPPVEVSPEDWLVLSVPMTVTWLPEASTGAVTASPVWLPDTMPSWPDVLPGSSAEAAVAESAMPRTVKPPAIALPSSTRRMGVRMTVS